MVNNLLVNIVNSVLGVGKPTARGNQAYHCPFCHHTKPKLEINFDDAVKGNPWHCWVCNKKGTNLVTLFKQAQEEWCYYSGMPSPKAYEEPQPIEFDDDSTDDDEYNPPADRNIGNGYVDYTEDE